VATAEELGCQDLDSDSVMVALMELGVGPHRHNATLICVDPRIGACSVHVRGALLLVESHYLLQPLLHDVFLQAHPG